MPSDDGSRQEDRPLRFSAEDVELFAAASGDRNPLHLDAAFARRTPFGSCVVHGSLVAIGLLGSLPPQELAKARAVRVRFAGPVMPGALGTVRIRRSRRITGAWDTALTGRGKVLAQAVAGPDHELVAKSLSAGISTPRAPGAAAKTRMRLIPAQPTALALSPGVSILGDYCAGPELATLARRFGADRLDPALLEGLAWASYVVGMELPGLHSLLAGITLAASGHATSRSAWHSISVREHDSRTGQLVLDGALLDRSGLRVSKGAIECFALTPVAALDPEALGVGEPAEADRGSVVVIGGSRGFGAALTLALLARGYRVHAVYSRSSDSAEGLARLAGGHRDRLALHRLDAKDPVALDQLAQALAPEAPLVGVVLGAAPPPLPMGLSGESGVELAEYVGDSLQLTSVPLGSLLPLLGTEAWILFCSSSALLAPPRDWPHYVTAKAAIEGLARWVTATAPAARAVVLRAPAMRTELTNTPTGRLAALPTEGIATWTADRLVGGELPPGLSLLEPNPVVSVSS